MTYCPICRDHTLWTRNVSRDLLHETQTNQCSRCHREVLVASRSWQELRQQSSDTYHTAHFLPINFAERGTLRYHLEELGRGYLDCSHCGGVTQHVVLLLRNPFHGCSSHQCVRCSHRTTLISAGWADLENAR